MKISGYFSNRKLLASVFFIAVLISAILLVFSFSIGIYDYDVYDYIEGVFWAEATLRSASIINPDYLYYYIVPFGSNLIMAPFVLLLGSNLLANQLGMLVYFLIYLFVLYRLSCLLYKETWMRFVFCAMVSLFVFTYVGDNLLHHLLIYGIGFVCLLGELSCIIEIHRHHHVGRNLILLSVFCLWSAANGIASAALANVPILLAAVFCAYRSSSIRDRERLISFLAVIASTLLGLLVYKYLDQQAIAMDKYQKRFMFADTDAIVSNLFHDLWVDYLKIFYFDPQGVPVFSLQGIYMLIKLFFALLIPTIPVVLKRSSQNNEDRDLIIYASQLAFAVCLGQYVFMQTSILRYLMNGVLSLFVICSLSFTDHLHQGGNRLLLLGMCLLALLLSYKTLFYTLPYHQSNMQEYARISEVLDDHGLTYGYSLKRHYKVVELLSDSEIRDSVIGYEKNRIKFHVKKDRIYPEERHKPEDVDRFYIISEPGSDPAIDAFLESHCIEKIDAGLATVYIFDIKEWDNMFNEG